MQQLEDPLYFSHILPNRLKEHLSNKDDCLIKLLR